MNGKKIKVVKFRSMVNDAEKEGAKWSDGDNDSRITKVGSFIRKTRLDELPQLWSCVTGEMSLIGPRPEREMFYEAFEEHVHGFSQRLKVKPGITSWGMVMYGYADTVDKMIERLKFDIIYLENISLKIDLKILIYTILTIVKGKGV